MIVPSLVFTVMVKSELTGNRGSCTIQLEPSPENMLERFYEAVRNCLVQVAGDAYTSEDQGEETECLS